MRKTLRGTFLFFLLFTFAFHTRTNAQVTLGTSPYTQDFNAIASGLPAGWSVRTGATATATGTSITPATAATSWSTSTGNFRNVAAAQGLTATSIATDQSNSTNRAIAVRQTGAFGDPGAAFVLQLSNTAGFASLSLNFNLQSLDGSAAGRTTAWKVDYGLGATPSAFTFVNTSPASLTTTLSSAGWGSTNVTVDFGSALDNYNDIVWIRIVALSGSTGSGSRPTTAIDDVALSFVAGDITPPNFIHGTPVATVFAPSYFTFLAEINEPGNIYFVVLPHNAISPTSVQVKNGTDATGATLPVGFSGSLSGVSATGRYNFSTANQTDGTEYDIYVVAEDISHNLQPVPAELVAATISIGDVTPPDFVAGYPRVVDSTFFSAMFDLSLTEAGKVWYVALPENSPAPSADQVVLGQDASYAGVRLAGSFDILSGNNNFANDTIAGLTPSTTYDIYFVGEDNAFNAQTTPTKLTVTTESLFAENFNNCNGTASFSSYSVTGDQSWGCVDFGYNSTKGIRMNGFNGTPIANEDWLISPVVSLGVNALLSFYSQFSFAGNGLQLKVSTDYTGSGDPSQATWTDLDGQFPTVAVGSTSTSNADWTLSNVPLSLFNNQNVYIAFVYTSTATAAARWTLDEVTIQNGAGHYLSVTPGSLSFSETGSSKTYSLSGSGLPDDVTVTAPANFLLSKDDAGYSSALTFTAEEASGEPIVYVKFAVADALANTYTGVITNSSPGVGSRNVQVTGTDKTQTFDVATYNLEFFASNVKDATGVEFGPTDDVMQAGNVLEVIQNINADIYGVEEISNDTAFNQMVSMMPGYDKIISDRWSYSFQAPDPFYPPQKTGFIFNTSTVQVINSRVMFAAQYDSILAGTLTLPNYPDGTSSSFWSSGRLPFLITIDVTIKGVKKRITMIDIHSKSGSDQDSYNRRQYDVKVLHDSLVAHYANTKVILVGDYNDDVDTSILPGAASTYKIFVDDTKNFDVLTYPLSLTGAYSFPNSTSFLDHLIISNELVNDFVPNSVAVEDGRNYIFNYINTTSDHLPVSARFLWKADQAITFTSPGTKTYGDPIFTLSATSSSGLPIKFASDDPTVASVHGDTVTIHKPGVINIIATQTGGDSYEPADSVFRVLTVNKANQFISFGVVADKTMGDAPFSVPATVTSGLAINFTTLSAKVTLSGNQVTLVTPGRVTITAAQPGNDDYNAAISVDQSFCIKPAKPVITIDNKLSAATLTSSAASGNQWYVNGSAIAGATSPTYNVTASGLYSVQAKVDDCLSASSDAASVIITGDITIPSSGVQVFPNPASTYIDIRGLSSDVSDPLLINMSGQYLPIVLEKSNDTYRASIQHLAQGIYFLQVRDGLMVHHVKFVKTN